MPEINEEHEVMTLPETAKFLRIHYVTAYRKVMSGEIPGWKMGRVWRCKRSVLEKLLAGNVHSETALRSQGESK